MAHEIRVTDFQVRTCQNYFPPSTGENRPLFNSALTPILQTKGHVPLPLVVTCDRLSIVLWKRLERMFTKIHHITLWTKPPHVGFCRWELIRE